jgi:hypothetical protein
MNTLERTFVPLLLLATFCACGDPAPQYVDPSPWHRELDHCIATESCDFLLEMMRYEDFLQAQGYLTTNSSDEYQRYLNSIKAITYKPGYIEIRALPIIDQCLISVRRFATDRTDSLVDQRTSEMIRHLMVSNNDQASLSEALQAAPEVCWDYPVFRYIVLYSGWQAHRS